MGSMGNMDSIGSMGKLKMPEKNIRLLLSLAGLLLLLVFSLIWSQQQSRSTVLRAFVGVDTAQVVRIDIGSGGSGQDTVRLAQGGTGQRWQVNGRYAVNKALMRSLWELLQRATRTQAVSSEQYATLQAQLQEAGHAVRIVHADGSEVFFRLMGHAVSSHSYVQSGSEGAIWRVQFTGYDVRVAGIFALSAEQWRHRVLFQSNPYTLEAIELRYTERPGDNVSIRLTERGPEVLGLTAMDTAAVWAYLERFRRFYTNEYIRKGQTPYYDSLLAGTPWGMLRVRDVNQDFSRTLWMFGASDERYYLLKDQAGDYSLCESQRLNTLLAKKSDFLYRGEKEKKIKK